MPVKNAKRFKSVTLEAGQTLNVYTKHGLISIDIPAETNSIGDDAIVMPPACKLVQESTSNLYRIVRK